MVVPVLVLGEGLVQTVVEVLVVGEDDVSSNIVQEAFRGDVGGGQTAGGFVGVDQQPRGAVDLVQSLGGSQTGRAGTNDENVDRTSQLGQSIRFNRREVSIEE